jgi:Sulfotransferase family
MTQTHLRKRKPKSASEQISGLIFILAPPRSFSWRFCAALGQHPQMYALPELHLFSARTVGQWLEQCATSTFGMADGTLRAIAQVLFGEQTETSVRCASGWLRRRAHFTTAMVLEVLAAELSPRVIVEKSPSIVYSIDSMDLAYRMFPEAKFLHLVRHPLAHCDSVCEAIDALKKSGSLTNQHWLWELAHYPQPLPSEAGGSDSLARDPQRGWYALNMNICNFLEYVPKDQQMKVRVEDYLDEPDKTLKGIVRWIGLSTDPRYVREMRHPERSSYMKPGPPNACYGNDSLYLATPSLHGSPANKSNRTTLRGGFRPETVDLAERFGYRHGLR